MAQVVGKTPRWQGFDSIWYFDDIFIHGEGCETLNGHLNLLIRTCAEAGLIINEKNSQLFPSHQLNYLDKKAGPGNPIHRPPATEANKGMGHGESPHQTETIFAGPAVGQFCRVRTAEMIHEGGSADALGG